MSDADELLLTAMVDALDRMISYVETVDLQRFLSDQMRIDAVSLNILVVGEGGSRLSKVVKDHVTAPWSSIVGMRHRIAHAYPGVDPKIVWTTATERAPELRSRIADALKGR